jgi:hypothetical protein
MVDEIRLQATVEAATSNVFATENELSYSLPFHERNASPLDSSCSHPLQKSVISLQGYKGCKELIESNQPQPLGAHG